MPYDGWCLVLAIQEVSKNKLDSASKLNTTNSTRNNLYQLTNVQLHGDFIGHCHTAPRSQTATHSPLQGVMLHLNELRPGSMIAYRRHLSGLEVNGVWSSSTHSQHTSDRRSNKQCKQSTGSSPFLALLPLLNRRVVIEATMGFGFLFWLLLTRSLNSGAGDNDHWTRLLEITTGQMSISQYRERW